MTRHQLEVLVDHADAESEGVGGVADVHRLAIDFDRTLVRRVGAEEYVHEAGFAGAVLAEEAKNIACVEGEVDAVAGSDGPEALRDAAHGDEGRCHWMRGAVTPPTALRAVPPPRSGEG